MEEKKYFITLTGAKKNVGDYLITDRCLALLKDVGPEFDFINIPHWEPFRDFDFINRSEGIIILGGPGFQKNMYPDVYKFFTDIDKINVPVYTLGTGWKGYPGDKTTEKLYTFTEPAKVFISKMENTSAGMSVRDYQTLRVLNHNEFRNVTMTGDPGWYELSKIGEPFKAPKQLKKIIFTPAQDHKYSEQSMHVMDYLKKKYPKADVVVSFHRGIDDVDKFTPQSDAGNNTKLATHAKKLNFEVVDISGDVDNLKFYEDCDFHIGYRVHAHLYFLSHRLPSILIHEDGRGNGVTEGLKTPGINAYVVSKLFGSAFGLFNKNLRILRLYGKLGMKVNDEIVSELDEILTDLEKSDFALFSDVTAYIDQHYLVMKNYIKLMLYGKLDK